MGNSFRIIKAYLGVIVLIIFLEILQFIGLKDNKVTSLGTIILALVTIIITVYHDNNLSLIHI